MKAIILACIIFYTGGALSYNFFKPITCFLAFFSSVHGTSIRHPPPQDGDPLGSLGTYLYPEKYMNIDRIKIETKKKPRQGSFNVKTKQIGMPKSMKKREEKLRSLEASREPKLTFPHKKKVVRRITKDRPIGPYSKTDKGEYCQKVTQYQQTYYEDCSNAEGIVDSEETEDIRKLKAFQDEFYETQQNFNQYNPQETERREEILRCKEIETLETKRVIYRIRSQKPSGPFTEETNGDYCQKSTITAIKKYNPCK